MLSELVCMGSLSYIFIWMKSTIMFSMVCSLGFPAIFTEDLLLLTMEPYGLYDCVYQWHPLKSSSNMQRSGYLLCFPGTLHQDKFMQGLFYHSLPWFLPIEAWINMSALGKLIFQKLFILSKICLVFLCLHLYVYYVYMIWIILFWGCYLSLPTKPNINGIRCKSHNSDVDIFIV